MVMSAQSTSCRWIRFWSILLLLGALLFAPTFAGGEDDPATGGSKVSTDESAETVSTAEATDTSETDDSPEQPQILTDWLLWWLTLGLLL